MTPTLVEVGVAVVEHYEVRARVALHTSQAFIPIGTLHLHMLLRLAREGLRALRRRKGD